MYTTAFQRTCTEHSLELATLRVDASCPHLPLERPRPKITFAVNNPLLKLFIM